MLTNYSGGEKFSQFKIRLQENSLFEIITLQVSFPNRLISRETNVIISRPQVIYISGALHFLAKSKY